MKPEVEPYFDQVIVERDDLKGFEHKLFLDEYSPYEKTFFFDADILILQDILPIIEQWSGYAYSVRGRMATEGVSSFGLDRKLALQLIEKDEFSVIDGAGHAYFEKPACVELFDKAREISKQYDIFQTNKFADEDAVGIAMTTLDIKPMENNGFLGSPWCAINDSFKIDTDKPMCKYDDLVWGVVEPYVVHFPRFIFPFVYARELIKTFKRHNIKVDGIWNQAAKEVFIIKVLWPVLKLRRTVIRYFKLS